MLMRVLLLIIPVFLELTAISGAQVPDMMKREDFRTSVTLDVDMHYWIYLPPDYEQRDDWPLLVFLHGAGERGSDMEKVKVHGPPKLVAEGKYFPFVIVSPQCSRFFWWYADPVAELTRKVANSYKIDKNRIYLTGLSMGGYGTWATVAKHPDLYAAIAPICGGGDPTKVAAHQHVPTWTFHGAREKVVKLKESEAMIEALTAAGAQPNFTGYPEAGHDSWTETYENPKLYEWFLSHSKKSP